MNRRLTLALCAIAFTACATQPIADSDAGPVPAKRITDASYLKDAPGSGTVVVKRDEGFLGAGACLPLLIDTVEIACFRSSEILVLHLPAGEHILSVGSRFKSNVPEIRIAIRSGETQRFRIGITEGGVIISPTGF